MPGAGRVRETAFGEATPGLGACHARASYVTAAERRRDGSVRTRRPRRVAHSYGAVGPRSVARLQRGHDRAGTVRAALLVRVAVGAAFAGPAYPDSYYYVHVAQQLAAGHGFSVDYIWNFVESSAACWRAADSARSRPTATGCRSPSWSRCPSSGCWAPIGLPAGLPMWLIGAAAAPLTYWIGRDAGFEQSAGRWCAGLLAAVPGGLTPFFGQPDNFGLFMTLGALSLWLCARGLRGDRRAFVLGGARRRTRHAGAHRRRAAWRAVRARLRCGSCCAAAAAAARRSSAGRGHRMRCAVRPRRRAVAVCASSTSSAASRPSASERPHPVDDRLPASSSASANAAHADDFLAQGIGPLLASRVGGFSRPLGLFAILPLVVVLAPFAVVGAWVRRRDHGVRAVLRLCGRAVRRQWPALRRPRAARHVHPLRRGAAAAHVPARQRRHWRDRSLGRRAAARRGTSQRATVAFGYGAVVIAVLGAAQQTVSTVGQWSAARNQSKRSSPCRSTALPVTDRVMSVDPGAYHYLTGHPGLVTPSDDLATIEIGRAAVRRALAGPRSARTSCPRWRRCSRAADHPTWLSAPVAIVPRTPTDPSRRSPRAGPAPPARSTPSASQPTTRGARLEQRDAGRDQEACGRSERCRPSGR